MSTLAVRGSIPSIVRNDEGLYEGNLEHYFKAVFNKAQNLSAPYHNLRHMLHVTYVCHEAIRFYQDAGRGFIPRRARNLMVAAIFHDFNHTGRAGNDDLNIQYAVRGFRANIAEQDNKPEWIEEVSEFISWTEFPYKVPSNHISLPGQILRDADLTQAMSVAWLQQVVIGLASEWGKTPLEVLRMQKGFLGNLKFSTEWAMKAYGQKAIEDKIAEAEELLAVLEK